MSKWMLFIVALTVKTSVVAEDRAIAVTFDDLPFVMMAGSEPDLLASKTEQLVRCLTRESIPAVGFVNEGALYRDGRLQLDRVEVLANWLRAGFELGNHTHSHVSLNHVPLDTFLDEVIRGEEVIRPLSAKFGQKVRWFRHPFLHLGADQRTRDESNSRLAELGYAVAPVTINSAEWVFAAAYALARDQDDGALQGRIGSAYVDYMLAVVQQAEEMARRLFARRIAHVLLVHANALNADYFCTLAVALKRQGYRFVSIDEALQDDAYASRLPDRKLEGYSWLDRWARAVGFPPVRQVAVPDFVTRSAASVTGPYAESK